MPMKNPVTVEWLGRSTQGFPKHLPPDHPKKKSLSVQTYSAAQIRPEGKPSMICGVGDFVLMTPEYEGSPPYVGRVLDLYSDDKNRKMATIQWLYRSKDLKKSARPSSVAKDEIFYALRHVDPVEVDTIIDVIRIEFHLLEGTNGPIRQVRSRLYADDSKAPVDGPCAFTCSRLYDLGSKVVPLSVAKLEELEEDLKNPVSRQPAIRDSKSAATTTPTRPSAASKAAKAAEDAAAAALPSSAKKSATKSKAKEQPAPESVENDQVPASAKKTASSGSASTKDSAKSAASALKAKKSTDDAMDVESSPPSAKRTAPPPVVQRSRKILKVDEEEATKESPTTDIATQSDSAKSQSDSTPKSQKKQAEVATPSAAETAKQASQKSSEASAAAAVATKPSSSSSSMAKVKSDERASESAPVTTSSSTQKGVRYLDEELWNLVQEARVHIGRLEAMEVLGYLKLESLYYNNPQEHDVKENICPPPFIRSRMERPSMVPIVTKALELLNHKNRSRRSTPLGIQVALRELEKHRPGVVFGMLARSDSESFYHPNWMFPEAVSGPVFGSMLGMDGFRTLKMKYRLQDMYVPIECEGTLEAAAHRGFAKLVTSRFGFALIKNGDCQFEVAAAPSETYAQIFIKHSTGRMLTAPVPIDEGLLGFVKAIVCANENILPHQQNLRLQNRGDRKVHEDDKLTLKACAIEAFSTILLAEDDDSL